MNNSNVSEERITHASNVLKKIGRPVAYYPNIAKLLGSVKAGIFLCQFLYWEGKQHDPNGWIYKTAEEIREETGLSRDEQESARKRLRDIGILREKKKGLPGKMHFLFNWERFDHLFDGLTLASLQTSLEKNYKLDSGKTTNLIGDNPQTGKSSKANTSKGFRDFLAHQRLQTENTGKEYNKKKEEETGQPSVTSGSSIPRADGFASGLSSFFSSSSFEDSSFRGKKGQPEALSSSDSSSLTEDEQPMNPNITETAGTDNITQVKVAGRAGRTSTPRQKAPSPAQIALAHSLARQNAVTVPPGVEDDISECSEFIDLWKMSPMARAAKTDRECAEGEAALQKFLADVDAGKIRLLPDGISWDYVD